MFIKDKYDPRLNNHPLKWDFFGLRSINLTGDYRIIFRENQQWYIEIIELIDVNTHSELYK